MAILNIQITNASLLDIEGGIGTGVDNGAWISTFYLIGEIVVIPLTDYLSKVFSFRYYIIVNTILFSLFSVACAFTHDLPSMIAMRGLQGFAGGVLIPIAFTMVLTKLPKAQQPVGLAMFALSVTFAPAIGPTIGGYLTENYGWQTIFFVNTVPSAVMVIALSLTLEREPMQLQLLKEGDWAGIVTMAIGLSALQTVLEEGNKDDWFGLYSAPRRGGAGILDSLHRHRAESCEAARAAAPAEAAQLRDRRVGQCPGRLRAVRDRVHPAAISRSGAALQRRADRERAGVDGTAAAGPYPAGSAAHEACRRASRAACHLIKPVLALDGQTVCRAGALITVDGRGSARPAIAATGSGPSSDPDSCGFIRKRKLASAVVLSCATPVSLDVGARAIMWPQRRSDTGAPVTYAARFAFLVAALKVNTMDLTTLITACALTVDPKIMHALTWHQSGGEPWAFSVSGRDRPQVLKSVEDAVRAARDTQPKDVVIRGGLTGLPGTPRSVTATMFTPCSFAVMSGAPT